MPAGVPHPDHGSGPHFSPAYSCVFRLEWGWRMLVFSPTGLDSALQCLPDPSLQWTEPMILLRARAALRGKGRSAPMGMLLAR